VLPVLAVATAVAAAMQIVVGAHLLDTRFGAASTEIQLVCALMLAGVALGAHGASRGSGRIESPRRAYAFAQVAQAAFAIVMMAALPFAAHAFAVLGGGLESSDLISSVRVLVGSLGFLPVALLLGASLASLSRAFLRDATADRDLGILAAVLAFGGASGLAGAAFLLAPAIGFRAAWLVAAGLNAAVGLSALFRTAAIAASPERVALSRTAAASPQATAFFLPALTSFVLFAIPPLWMRALVFAIGDSASSRGLVLVVAMSGNGIGSLLAAMFARRIRNPMVGFAFVSMAAALAIVITTSFFDDFAAMRASSFAASFLPCALGVLPPAILLGMGIAIVLGVARNERGRSWEFGGFTSAFLLAGSVGLIAATFLPAVGVRDSLLLMAALTGIAGIFALGRSTLPRSRRLSIALGFAAIFLVIASLLPPWDASKLASGTDPLPQDIAKERILEVHEGRTATVFVKRSGSDLELNVNGHPEARATLDRKSNILLAELPFLFQPKAKSALIFGLETGTTLSAVAQHSLDSIECIEPLEGIFAAWPQFRDGLTKAALPDISKDSRVHIRSETARSRILRLRQAVDVLLLSCPSLASSERHFIPQEFARLCRARMAADGVLAMRIPADFLSVDSLRSLLATLLPSFPNVDVWVGQPNDVIVTASSNPLPLSFETIVRRFDDPAIGAGLRKAGIGDAPTLLSHHLLAPKVVAQWAQGASPFADDRPWMPELARTTSENAEAMQKLLSLRTDPLQRISDANLFPSDSEAYARLQRAVDARRLEIEAFAQDAAGRGDEALETLRQAASTNPHDIAIRRNLARLCVRIGLQALREQNYGRAHSLLTEAIETDSGSVDAAAGLADLSLAGGNSEDALKWAQRVLELDPDNDSAYAQMGDAYRAQGRWTEARDAYLKALERFPDNVSATLHLAEALTYTGDPEGAVAKIEKARRLGAPIDELQRIRKFVRQDG